MNPGEGKPKQVLKIIHLKQMASQSHAALPEVRVTSEEVAKAQPKGIPTPVASNEESFLGEGGISPINKLIRNHKHSSNNADQSNIVETQAILNDLQILDTIQK